MIMMIAYEMDLMILVKMTIIDISSFGNRTMEFIIVLNYYFVIIQILMIMTMM